MNIQGTLTKGIAPVEIVFSIVGSMVKLTKWLWNFGDGSISSEFEPRHTYRAPGIYTVSLTAWDEYGNEYSAIKIDYIYVYDFPLGSLLSGYTDFCFRHAVKPAQGQGIAPVGGKWVWPMVVAATAKGYSRNYEHLSLIVDGREMRIYQIGIPELWTDRNGTYEESEIPCEVMLPEIVPRFGEQENVRHVETHSSMRSWDEKNYRGKTGYTADGFRNSQVFSIEAYQGGEQIVPTTKLQKVDKDGDYAFLKDVEAKRFQLKLKYATSAFRTTRITTHLQEIDHRTPPQFNDVPEKQWQKELAIPDIWFSRNKPSMLTNRADGKTWVGAGTVVAGPDGKATTAFNSTGISGITAYAIADFMVSGWLIGDGGIYRAQVNGGGTVVFGVTGDTLYFIDGTDTINVILSPDVGWRHVTVIRRGINLDVYQNGKLKSTTLLSGVRPYGGNTVIGNGGMFDIRRIPSVVSAEALYYYYQSVLDGGGGVLP
jgi:PKD repeat protein